MTEPVPMTPAGLKKLQEELKHLKGVERPKNLEEIEVARGHGDLSENAEYLAAKERQSYLSFRLAQLEDIIARAQVIDASQMNHQKVVFGATVKVSDVDSGEEVTYQIVGKHESDIKKGKISVESPIAKSLIGKEVGEVVRVVTPKGAREFELRQISYQ